MSFLCHWVERCGRVDERPGCAEASPSVTRLAEPQAGVIGPRDVEHARWTLGGVDGQPRVVLKCGSPENDDRGGEPAAAVGRAPYDHRPVVDPARITSTASWHHGGGDIAG